MQSQIEEYLASLHSERGLSANTIAAYRRDLRDYAGSLGGAAPSPEGASAFVQGLHVRGLAPSSIARKVAALRGFHRYLVVEGLAAEDPTVLLEAPRRRAGLPKALTVDEVLALLDAERPRPPQLATADAQARRPLLERRYQALRCRDRALVEFMYATGARVDEAVRLHRLDLEMPAAGEPGWATARLFGKGRRERIVPMGREACRAIAAYEANRADLVGRPPGPSEFFLNSRGAPLTRQGVWGVLRERAARAGIDPARVSPHVLRHSAATHMVEGGADLRVVQEFLGHATISTTQVYTRVAPPHLREVYATSHPRSRSE